jgi:uncharacterized protein DUF4129
MPGRGARSGVDARRAAAVLLLLGVAAVGLRAGGVFSSAGSGSLLGMSERALNSVLSAAVAVLAVVGLVLLVVGLLWRRKGEDGRPKKRRSIWWVLLLPLFVFGLAKFIHLLHSRGITTHLGLRPGGGRAVGAGSVHHPPPGDSWTVFGLFAVVALLAFALTWYRRRRRSPPPVFATPAPEPAAPLADALAAGEQALSADVDPRTAIIGCYAAMERSLAEAGSPAAAADTPTEVLARATAGGLVQSSWAGTLTGLFRRARYSRHPMTEADRAAAMGALAQVRADLGGAS